MHPRLAELIDHAEAVRRDLQALVDAFPADRAQVAPASGGWSLSQQLAHLHLVEHSSVRAMFRALKDARKTGLAEETETSSLLGGLDATDLVAGTHKLEAPEFVVPSDAPDVPTAMARLAESREALHAWAREADGFALATVTFPHPRLGVLNLYQWILMIAGHERRHMAQIERLRAEVAA